MPLRSSTKLGSCAATCLSMYRRFGRAGLIVFVVAQTLKSQISRLFSRHGMLRWQGPRAAETINSFVGTTYRVAKRGSPQPYDGLDVTRGLPTEMTDDNYPMT